MSARVFSFNKSKVLKTEENFKIQNLVGERCDVLSTAVIQIYETEDPFHNEWIKMDSGVICYIKDHNTRTYCFRLYNLSYLTWEHELYKQIEFTKPKPYLVIFEGNDKMIAFNFTDLNECNDFFKQIHVSRTGRRVPPKIQSSNVTTIIEQPKTFEVNLKTKKKIKKNKKKDKNKPRSKLSLQDIGTPINFQHISHVGLDVHKNLNINIDDPELNEIFCKAGISNKQLENPKVVTIVNDFIRDNGGVDSVKKKHRESKDNFLDNPIQSIPPVPVRNIPKIVQSSTSLREIKAQSASKQPPPPPPPPPPTNAHQPNVSPAVEERSNLLMEIQRGKQLKAKPEGGAIPERNPHNNLLLDIQKGFKLKSVDENERNVHNTAPKKDSGDIADALARAIQIRSNALQSDSDSDDDEENSDWES